jgi:DNA polymerase I-like protein with 3'-5' exonuclease and polymerase domains
MNLRGSEDAVKAYSEEGADFHQIVADMANIPRKQAKNINLGLTYGMGHTKLIKELGVEEDEARTLLEQYHQRVPFIRALQDQCARVALERGHIKTLGGRKCRFDFWEPVHGDGLPLVEEEAKETYGNIRRSYTYKALNRLIQGSAADMTKIAMLDLWKEGYVPHLQIHDELDYSVGSEEEGEFIMEKMAKCVDLSVPLVVDAEYGETWGDSAE